MRSGSIMMFWASFFRGSPCNLCSEYFSAASLCSDTVRTGGAGFLLAFLRTMLRDLDRGTASGSRSPLLTEVLSLPLSSELLLGYESA